MTKKLPQIVVGLAVVLLLAMYVFGKIDIGVINELENLTYDSRVKFTASKRKDDRIVIIDIDEKTLRELGQWPWPREMLAAMIDNLFDIYGVYVFGIDMVFAERDSRSGREKIEQKILETDDPVVRSKLQEIVEEVDGDIILSEALRGRNIVLGYYFNVDEKLPHSVGKLPEPVFEDDGFMNLTLFPVKATSYNANLALLQDSVDAAGFFSDPLIDEDGITRRVPLLHEFEGAIYESLALSIARTYLQEIVVPVFGEAEVEEGIPLMTGLELGEKQIQLDSRGAIMIPFKGKRGSFTYVSASDVINQTISSPDLLRGKIAILGTTALGLADLRATPVDAVFPGVEAQANIVAGILDENIKNKSAFAWAIELACVVAIGSALAFSLPFFAPLTSSIIVISSLMLVFLGNMILWMFFDSIIPVATTLIAILLVYVVNAIYNLFSGARHIREIRKSFSSYLAPSLVDKLVEDPSSLKLEGESRIMTFLFTDIAGFTRFTEETEAKLLVKVLNEYLDQACQIVMDYGGTIDKMIGDAIVAIFNAPLEIENHEQKAVLTAMALDHFCTDFARQKNARGIGMGITRIGVNTGRAVVGNFGGESRFDYTVIGDAVNTAARMESVNKFLGTRICVSESTVEKCPDLFFRPVANLVLKGKSQDLNAYEPVTEEQFSSDQVQRYIAFYEKLKTGSTKLTEEAQLLVNAYPNDPVLKLHLDRINAGQTGVCIVMDEK